MTRPFLVTDEQLIRFIRDYGTAHGYAPSVREIMRGVGFASTSAVSYRLRKLEEAGLLERRRRISRGMPVACPACGFSIGAVEDVA